MNHETKLNRNASAASTTSSDALDQLLSAHFAPGEELQPSAGFRVSVMEALQSEAAGPSPLQFPWRRVIPGIIALLCALAVFGMAGAAFWKTGDRLPANKWDLAGPMTWSVVHLSSMEQAIIYASLAAVLSIAVAIGSMRLAAGGRQ